MQNVIIHDSTGIPLHLFEKNQYSQWLEQQSSFVKNWLEQSQYKEQGLALIPSKDGALETAIFVSENLSDFFATADLAKVLPAKTFLLKADAEHQLNTAIAFGLTSYRFDKYKAVTQGQPKLAIADKAIIEQADKFIAAATLVRDMINTPASDMMPQHMSVTMESLACEFGAQFSEIIGDELLTQNYPTIHAVGRASCHAPRLLDMHWGNTEHPKVTLVGKGVCFDSGGLDLKPGAAMRNMKKDMGGAAHVLGLARLIMSHHLPINLRVLVPSVENAVSDNAFRPGDVLTTRHGLTVEIDNTDAEGRLVLCDALSEANNDNPELIIDFATLTGACRVALGTELPGFFTNDQATANALMLASEKSQDPVWQLPLHQAYKDMLKSDIADMVNSVPSPFGGAITAALYLEAFVKKDTPWVHFDVMAWNNRSLPGRPIGGEAMGIRAAFDMLATKYQ
ncbi:leucyl aminopeptidase family protein [Pseudomonas sp. HK3]